MARGTPVELDMEKLKKRLQKIRENLANPSPTMQKVSILMYKDILNHFEKEQSPDGSRWKKSERAKKQSGKTLQDNGMLKKSVEPSNTKYTAIVKAGDAMVPYARIHNLGGTFKTKGRGKKAYTVTMPKRNFLWISAKVRDQIRDMVGKFVIADPAASTIKVPDIR